MICDAHVHVGYYERFGRDEPFYWSPRRVVGVLRWCGVGEFIVSSTNAQIAGIAKEDILREAHEMRLRAGPDAHQFYWLSGRLYDEDPSLSFLNTGLFEGLKLHELETPWMQQRERALLRILSIAAERGLPVQMHCAPCAGCSADELATLAARFPTVRFDFAHFKPADETIAVMERCPNIFADVATFEESDYEVLPEVPSHVTKRLLFGTDFPALHSRTAVGLSAWYRTRMRNFGRYFDAERAAQAFRHFLSGTTEETR
jgi:hypothetical protein